MFKVHVYGNSHANACFKGFQCENHYANALTLHRVGRDGIEVIDFKRDQVAELDIIFLLFGEIDCRCHVKRQLNLGRDITDIMNELVDGYFNTINTNRSQFDKLDVVVCSVPPTTRQEEHDARQGPIRHEFPFVGSEKERSSFTKFLNRRLRTRCDIENVLYLDFHDYYAREDGTLRFELSDNICHIEDNRKILELSRNLIESIVDLREDVGNYGLTIDGGVIQEAGGSPKVLEFSTIPKPTTASEVADLYEKVGLACESAGFETLAGHAFAAAAEIDLGDDELQRCWGGPLNGQEGRCRLFLDILRAIKPGALVETGTYRGTTTTWFASNFPGPIYSCELNRRFYLQAKTKLSVHFNVQISLSDSRSFLKRLIPELENKGICIFYLDAHWNADCPLIDELNLIHFSNIPAVIMIDDFEVPYDIEYIFDDYGDRGKLNLNYIGPVPPEFALYFPTLRASEETGARRGCCILSNIANDILGKLSSLRRYDGGPCSDSAL